MGEKRRELSEFERGQIVGAHHAGMTERSIAEMYGFAKSTVNRVINDFEKRGLTKPPPMSGRLPKLKESDKSRLTELVEENHLASLSEITAQFRDLILDDVSESTIRRALHEEGYFGRVGLRKPFISEVNRERRLQWANQRASWRNEWNFFIWSDESRYVVSGTKRRRWVWGRPEQKMDVDCLVPTLKKKPEIGNGVGLLYQIWRWAISEVKGAPGS